jgi:SAM-dependent methyltransferase
MVAQRAERYWWYRARRNMSLDLLRRAGVPARCRWLDLGVGPGGNLALLDPLEPALIVGLDISPLALSMAKESHTRAALVRADINKTLPFRSASFDVVTMFNVLYHQWVLDDAAVLSEATRVLRKRGILLMTEPAFPVLAREMDVAAMGRRRYRLAEIAAVCTSCGLEVLLGSYFTSFGVPILLGMKALRWAAGRSEAAPRQTAIDMRPLHTLTNAIVYWAAMLEARLIAGGLTIPCGTTLVCVARKPREAPALAPNPLPRDPQ